MKELALHKAVLQGKQHVKGVGNVLVQFLNLILFATKNQQVVRERWLLKVGRDTLLGISGIYT